MIRKPNLRFLYIAYYDLNGKQVQESAKSESLQVAEGQLRKRLEEISKGVAVAEDRKLKYQDIKELLLARRKRFTHGGARRREGCDSTV